MMAPYEIRFTKEALKDIQKLSPKMTTKLKNILENLISTEPHSGCINRTDPNVVWHIHL